MLDGRIVAPPGTRSGCKRRVRYPDASVNGVRHDGLRADEGADGGAPAAFTRAVYALVGGLLVFVYSHTVADPDLWGHLRFGLDFWQHGLARTDPYSYLTRAGAWVNHEWAAESLLAFAWDRGGALGVATLKVALVLGTAAVAIRHLRASGVSAIAASTWFLYGWLLALPWLTSFRPQAFTYLAFACTIALVARADRGDARALWWGVPLFAAWANLHGGVLAGMAIVLAWLAARVVTNVLDTDTVRPVVPRLAVAQVVALLLATSLNPYAHGLWSFLRTALVARPEISEWNPVDTGGLEGVVFLLVLVPAAASWLLTRRPTSPPLVVVFCVCAVAPLMARRHTPLFALAAIMLAGEHVADGLHRLVTGRAASAPAPSARLPRWLTAFVWVVALGLAAGGLPHARQVWYDPSSVPVDAVRALARCGVRADMIVFFDWGEYAIWHLAPRIRVSMDGRRETVYADDVYAENMGLADGVGQWDAILRRSAPSLALVSPRFAGFNLMKQERGWTLARHDAGAALFVRDGGLAVDRRRCVTDAPRVALPDRAVFP